MTPEQLRAEELKAVPLVNPDKASWPSHVREIGIGEMDNLGIDKDRNLYWAGQRIEVKRALTFWQKIVAGLITLFTLLAAIAACASAYADLCQAGFNVRCPPSR